jgi:hypothetical protein
MMAFLSVDFNIILKSVNFKIAIPERYLMENIINGNPDLIAAVQQGNITAIEHFVNLVSFEGRSPSPLYNK